MTKIDKIALGLECKGEPLHSSLSIVALEKSEIVKKTCSLKGNGRKRFWPSILYPTFTTVDFYRFLCTKCTRGVGTPVVPKPITILGHPYFFTAT